MCENYLLSSHRDDIFEILENPDKERYFSVNINFLDLFESDTNLGNALLTCPEESLKSWNEAVFNVQTDLLKELDDKYTLKSKVTCRIYSLPPWPHVSRTIFPGNCDANKFMQVTGTVVRISARKLLEYQRQYICVKCKYPIIVKAKYDKGNIIKQPKMCLNPEGCNSKNILTFGGLDTYNCKDYQEIKIQEDLSKMDVGTIPNHMIVTLDDDLVDVCKPGENVTITGVVTQRWSEFDKGAKIIIDIVLKANHVQVNNSSGLSMAVSDEMKHFFNEFWKRYANEPLVGRNVILNSISPEIYGLHLVKLAMAVVLAGGSQCQENEISTGIDTRSESHLLFVGDPGTGKSEMLRFASKIIPRSVLTTGVGSTAAGLTVTAIMEAGEWQLEAGALVMSDGGICCIDEFNSMREHDRTSIHEAMEQQTISVAKAGMVCKLKTRCSILAACNPKGNINPSQPLCVNIAMSSPLLSRFDLILLIRDVVNEGKDRILAECVLNKEDQLKVEGMMWNLEQLQAYYALIRKRNLKLTKEAETILSTYYQLQRKFGSRNKSRTTVRLLESLIRLSQGHAKLMYHNDVQVSDAIFAITLMDTAMDFESSLLNLNLGNNSFFDNPEQLYWNLLENILGKLNLDYVYQKEIEKMGKESPIDSGSQENEETSERMEEIRPNPINSNNGLFSQSNEATSGHLKFLFTQNRNEVNRCDSEEKMQRESNSNQPLFNKKTVLQKYQEENISSMESTCSQMLSQSFSQDNNSKRVNKFQRKSLNESEDSGNFSDMTNLNMPSTKINKENLPGKIDPYRASTSKDLPVHNMRTSKAEASYKKGTSWSRIVKSNCEMDLDVDFDQWFNNIKSSNNENSKSPPNKNKPETIFKNKKRQSTSPLNSIKKCSKSNKKHVKNKVDLMKLVPSVNDDFANFDMQIDWDMEEEVQDEQIGDGRLEEDSLTGRLNDSPVKLQEDKTREKSPKKSIPGFSELLNQFKFRPNKDRKTRNKLNFERLNSKTDISNSDAEINSSNNLKENSNNCKSSEISTISVSHNNNFSQSKCENVVTSGDSKGKCQESHAGIRKSKFKNVDLDLEFDSDSNPFEECSQKHELVRDFIFKKLGVKKMPLSDSRNSSD